MEARIVAADAVHETIDEFEERRHKIQTAKLTFAKSHHQKTVRTMNLRSSENEKSDE